MMRDEATIHPDMKPLLDARRLMSPVDDPAEKRRNWTRYTSAIALPRGTGPQAAREFQAPCDFLAGHLGLGGATA